MGGLGQTTGPQLGGVAASRAAVPWGYTPLSWSCSSGGSAGTHRPRVGVDLGHLQQFDHST